MSRLLLPFADQHVEIPSLSAGNIALTVGLKQVHFQFISRALSHYGDLISQVVSVTNFVGYSVCEFCTKNVQIL